MTLEIIIDLNVAITREDFRWSPYPDQVIIKGFSTYILTVNLIEYSFILQYYNGDIVEIDDVTGFCLSDWISTNVSPRY